MSFKTWKRLSSPQLHGQPCPFKTQEDAQAVCEREGIPIDVELADRGPDVVWATIEPSSVGD
jgi:hypothetical protein